MARSQRTRLEARLRAESRHDLADRLRDCGLPVRLVCQCCGVMKEVEKRCDRRWCPVCQRAIAAARVARYRYAAARMTWPLFVTLTIPNSERAWDGLRRIRAAFGRFRRTRFWNNAQIAGGVASIEITNRGRGWHPHLHSLMDCRWLAVDTTPPYKGDDELVIRSKCVAAQAELAAAWAACIREPAGIVWVTRASGGATVEVLKYAADPGTMLESEGSLGELIDAIDQHRLISTWGNCYGIGRLVRELAAEDRAPRPCDACGKAAWTTYELAMRNGCVAWDREAATVRPPWEEDGS